VISVLNIYINPKDKDQHHDQNMIMNMLENAKIEYITTNINNVDANELKELKTKMRENRVKLSHVRGPENKWQTSSLLLPPIIETDFGVFPWWYTREKLDSIIVQLEQKTQKPKIKRIQIKRITNKTTVNLTATSEARINVTILRALNNVNIYDIMNEWPLAERAAGMIMWRLAQHMKATDLFLLADMITEKAMLADPYRKQQVD